MALDRTKSQWVDLGIHTDVCMTRPETCGAAGGAISLWVNVIECSDWEGIISSYNRDVASKSVTSAHIYCGEKLIW